MKLKLFTLIVFILFASIVSSCSDSIQSSLSDYKIKDFTVDIIDDDGIETGIDIETINLKTYTVYLHLIDTLDIGSSEPSISLTILSEESPPILSLKPDFVNGACKLWKWSPANNEVWNWTVADMGKITLTGHETIQYLDGADPTKPPQVLPATIECARKEMGIATGLYDYDCDLPKILSNTPNSFIPFSSLLKETSSLEFKTAGGVDIPSFTLIGMKSNKRLKVITNLNQINPANFKIEWDPKSTEFYVVAFLHTYLADWSEMATGYCIVFDISADSFTIPPGLVAAFPKPTTAKSLYLKTSVVTAPDDNIIEEWGKVRYGIEKGFSGTTCLTPTGQCSSPSDAGL